MSDEPETSSAPAVRRESPRNAALWLSLVAGFCGVAGFAAGPLLIAGTPGRYLILVADILALALGGVGLWAAFKYRARFDWAVLGLVTGGISLFLYVEYVTGPSPAAGGT